MRRGYLTPWASVLAQVFVVAWLWVGQDGALHAVDDVEKVPAGVEVERVESGSLGEYRKYTPVDRERPRGEHEQRLRRRLRGQGWPG